MAGVPQPNLPHGYHFAPSTPTNMEFFTPNTNTQSEVDFNQFLFVTIRPGGGPHEYEDVPEETIKDIVSSPDSPWEPKIRDMLMVKEDGSVSPAFLPHFVDVIGKKELRGVFRRLTKYNQEYDGVSPVVPKMYKKVVDPKPVLVFEGPIYTIHSATLDLKMGCFADGLVVYHFAQPLSEVDIVVTRGYRDATDPAYRFNGVRITPTCEDQEFYLQPGWSFIVWNVRHAGRPSFKENFARLMQVHNPVAFLLTETRMYKPGFLRLDEAMELEMNWGIDESIGVSGGSVLLWDKTRAVGKTMVSGTASQQIRMLASLKPIGAPEDPSSPDEPTSPEEYAPDSVDGGSPEI